MLPAAVHHEHDAITALQPQAGSAVAAVAAILADCSPQAADILRQRRDDVLPVADALEKMGISIGMSDSQKSQNG
jgi:hypothetical protein